MPGTITIVAVAVVMVIVQVNASKRAGPQCLPDHPSDVAFYAVFGVVLRVLVMSLAWLAPCRCRLFRDNFKTHGPDIRNG